MATRGVWQLARLTVKYCDHSGSSRHVKEFLRRGLVPFAERNPQIDVQTELRPGRHPVLVGEYINGNTRVADLKNKELGAIWDQVDLMRNSSGRKVKKLGKPVVSERPSIQGEWTEVTEFGEVEVRHVY